MLQVVLKIQGMLGDEREIDFGDEILLSTKPYNSKQYQDDLWHSRKPTKHFIPSRFAGGFLQVNGNSFSTDLIVYDSGYKIYRNRNNVINQRFASKLEEIEFVSQLYPEGITKYKKSPLMTRFNLQLEIDGEKMNKYRSENGDLGYSEITHKDGTIHQIVAIYGNPDSELMNAKILTDNNRLMLLSDIVSVKHVSKLQSHWYD